MQNTYKGLTASKIAKITNLTEMADGRTVNTAVIDGNRHTVRVSEVALARQGCYQAVLILDSIAGTVVVKDTVSDRSFEAELWAAA
jgi:hypothetical protein